MEVEDETTVCILMKAFRIRDTFRSLDSKMPVSAARPFLVRCRDNFGGEIENPNARFSSIAI